MSEQVEPADRRATASSSALADVRLLVGREVTVRWRDRSLRISLGISLVVIVAVAVLPKVFGGGPATWEIAAGDPTAAAVAERVAAIAPDERDTAVTVLENEAAARAAVEDGTVDVALLASGRILGREEVDAELGATLQQAWTAQRLTDELATLGVPEDDIEALATAPPAVVELLDPPDVERDRRVGFAFIGSILLFTQLVGFGVWVAMSIVEDKASRVIEVLLAKVPPRTLLSGKVLGIGVVGVAELALMVGVGLAAFTLADRFPVPPGVWPLAGVLMVAFVLAFVLYASLFAISGALAARVEDVQSTTMPFTLLMTVAYIAAIAVVQDLDGAAARWLSLVPFSSPLVMPLRIADGSATWWEMAVAVALLLATAAALIVVADRAYRAGALRLRRTVKLRHALR